MRCDDGARARPIRIPSECYLIIYNPTPFITGIHKRKTEQGIIKNNNKIELLIILFFI